jgi:hypothetical protein
MHRNHIASIPILSTVVFLIGCTPAVSVPQEEYRTKVASVHIGISRQDFLAIFPKAENRGGKSYSNGVVEAYEVVVYRYHFGPTSEPEWNSVPGGQVKKVWFFFHNGNLVHFGNPNEWPEVVQQPNSNPPAKS